jgi:hypothetical protein
VLPGQHWVPGAPQGTQTFALLQMALASAHTPTLPPADPAQQAPPSSPHLAQMPLVQRVPGAVHPVFGSVPQQGRPGPPQVPHTPALHTPPPRLAHTPPSDMQMPDTQQPPPAQEFPVQHGKPGWPQIALLPPVPGATPPSTTPPLAAPPLPTMPPVPTTTPPEPGGVAASVCAPPTAAVVTTPPAPVTPPDAATKPPLL